MKTWMIDMGVSAISPGDPHVAISEASTHPHMATTESAVPQRGDGSSTEVRLDALPAADSAPTRLTWIPRPSQVAAQ